MFAPSQTLSVGWTAAAVAAFLGTLGVCVGPGDGVCLPILKSSWLLSEPCLVDDCGRICKDVYYVCTEIRFGYHAYGAYTYMI